MLKLLLRHSWPLTLLASLAGAVSGVAGAMLIGAVSRAAGAGATPDSALAWSFAGLCLLSFVSKTGADTALLYLSQSAVHNMRMTLSRQLLATPLPTLQRIGKAELMAILTNDIGAVAGAYQMLPMAFCHVIMIVACFAYLAWLSPALFAGFAVLFAVALLLYKWAERGPLRYAEPMRDAVDLLYERFRGLVEGSRELKLNSMRGRCYVDEDIRAAAETYRQVTLRSGRGYAWVGNFGSLLFYAMLGTLLLVLNRWVTVTTEALTTYSLVLLYLIGPISHLLGLVPAIRQAAVSLARIEQLGAEIGHAINETAVDETPDNGPGTIALQQVRHRYLADDGAQEFMLGPIDLSIAPNEILFIVGGNGSGKTTLAMLILGLYAPDSGTLTSNGVPVTDATRLAYRNQFAAIFSDFYLFDRVWTGDAPGAQHKAEAMLRSLRLADKVSLSNGRFSTLKLSSGQRRRLALVSACLDDRQVYLFDEWASDQDPVFKRTFYAELLPQLKAAGKTVIVITHDEPYFGYADRVVCLRDGQLAELHPAREAVYA